MPEPAGTAPVRILFVNRMASMVRGGGETFDLEIARHLERLGAETSFLSGIPLFSNADTPLDHPRSHTIRSPYTGWFPWDRVPQGWRLRVWDFERFEAAATRWILARQDRYDIMQICEMPPLVNRLKDGGCRLPVVMRITAPDYHDPRRGVQLADALLASGVSIARMRAGIRPDTVDIPNGVDTERFAPRPSDYRARRGIPADAFVVLFVARFQQVKNHAMLLDAFRRLRATRPDARLVLVGSGPLESRIRALLRQHDLADAVIIEGEVDFRNVPALYNAADVHVISSFSESFSFATLEAMASGLPLVVTATEWIPGLIGHDEGGRVVPVDDAPAFAAALAELAADPALRARMGERNRRAAVERHGWDASARKLLDTYRGLLRRVSAFPNPAPKPTS